MARTLAAIYRHEESVPVKGTCTPYPACPARAHRGRTNRSATCTAKYFHRWARAVGTYPSSHWEVCCDGTALRSPCSRPPLFDAIELAEKSMVGIDKSSSLSMDCHLVVVSRRTTKGVRRRYWGSNIHVSPLYLLSFYLLTLQRAEKDMKQISSHTTQSPFLNSNISVFYLPSAILRYFYCRAMRSIKQ